MSKKTYRTLVWSMSVLGVLCFIYAHSLAPASTSSEESRSFLDFLLVAFPSITHHMVRKLAHFAEYALLGAHLAFAPYLFSHRMRGSFFAALAFGLPCALLDEGIQSFVPGRGASFADVLIDYSGYLCAFLLLFFLFLLLRKERKYA